MSFVDSEPTAKFSDIERIEEFDEKLGRDFLPTFWDILYHLEFKDLNYLLPFALKYHLFNYDALSPESIVNLELFVIALDPVGQELQETRYRYDMNYKRFSGKQRRAVCEWLLFLGKYYLGQAESLKGATSYWCSDIL